MDSKTVVNILVEIAELEDLQAQAQHTILENASRDTKLRELQAEYAADAERADAETQKKGRDFRTRDREIREVEARLEDRRDLLVGVSDRKQHKALTDEIRSLEIRLDRLETEAIACLEEEDSRAEEADQVGRESREHGREAKASLQTMAADSVELEARIKNISLDMERLIGMLPPVEKRHVERLRQKLDQAVVFQHNGACCGCFNQLPVQEAINVERGRGIVRCPSCMRFIVHKSWR